MINNHRVILITGASSGIGKCCAEYLSQQGHRVYGTSRRIESTTSERLSSNTNLFQMIQMDVTDESSVKNGIASILARESRIHVVLIEPGDFKTEITTQRQKAEKSTENPAYRGSFQKVLRIVESGERKAPTPEPIARLIDKIIRKNSPRLRYTVGTNSQRIAVLLKKILPSRLFESLITNAFQAN